MATSDTPPSTSTTPKCEACDRPATHYIGTDNTPVCDQHPRGLGAPRATDVPMNAGATGNLYRALDERIDGSSDPTTPRCRFCQHGRTEHDAEDFCEHPGCSCIAFDPVASTPPGSDTGTERTVTYPRDSFAGMESTGRGVASITHEVISTDVQYDVTIERDAFRAEVERLTVERDDALRVVEKRGEELTRLVAELADANLAADTFLDERNDSDRKLNAAVQRAEQAEAAVFVFVRKGGIDGDATATRSGDRLRELHDQWREQHASDPYDRALRVLDGDA